MKMIALKAMGRLQPGDEFEVRRSTEARVLLALGKAKEAPPPEPRDILRAEAEAAGVDVDGRWGEDRLKEEIAAATEQPVEPGSPAETEQRRPARAVPRYQRRDMQPEE